MKRRTLFFLGAVGVLGVSGGLAACSRTQDAKIVEYDGADPMAGAYHFRVEIARGDFKDFEVKEVSRDDQSIVVQCTYRANPTKAVQTVAMTRIVYAKFNEPIGERKVIDATTGKEIPQKKI